MKNRIYLVLMVLNFWRVLPGFMISKATNTYDIVAEDAKRYRNVYNSVFAFSVLLVIHKIYRNVVWNRLYESGHKISAFLFTRLFPLKKDLELGGVFGKGLAIFHGHNTVAYVKQCGENVSIYQGVTIGRGEKEGAIGNPTIGNNVSIFPNAVIAGPIHIGDNCRVAAGTVVRRDIPDNVLVYGNPMQIHEKNRNEITK